MEDILYIWGFVAIVCFVVFLYVLWKPVKKQSLKKQTDEALFGVPQPRKPFDKRA